jgi:hypothetical protein
MKDDHTDIQKCAICCDAKSTRFFVEILEGMGHIVLCDSCSVSFLKIDHDMMFREVSFEEFVTTQVIES